MNADSSTPPASRRRNRSLWWYLLSLVVTLACFAFMARLVWNSWDTLVSIRGQLRFWPVVLTLPVFFLGELMAAFAWGKVMNIIARPLPMTEHFKVFVVTHAGRRLPGSLWYVVGRIAWYERLGISKVTTSFGSVLESLLILWSGLIMTSLLVLFLPGDMQKQIPLFLVGILISAALMHPRILGFVLRKLGQGEHAGELNWRIVLYWLGLYLPIWGIGGTILYLIINALIPQPISLLPVCIGVWSLVGVLGSLVLILPSSLGIGEATISLTMSIYIPASIAVAAAVLVRILLTFYEFAFAWVVYMLFGKHLFQKLTQMGDQKAEE